MWISKVVKTESREVSLVLGKGKEKKTLKEQTAFLAEISEYFEALFYNELAEHDKDKVIIEDCDARCLISIVTTLREAKEHGISIETIIKSMLSPKYYPTIVFFMIRVDGLHSMVLHNMVYHEMKAYSAIAKSTADIKLAKVVYYRSLGFFLDFRKSTMFKKKSIAGLKKYLGSKFLEYDTEKQILEAVLWWLNFNLKKRESHLEEALALVNWCKIKANQLKFMMKMKITKKSTRLRQIFAELLIFETVGESGIVLSDESVRKVTCSTPEREEKPFIISLPIQYKEIDENKKETYRIGVAFYDVLEEKMLDSYFMHPHPVAEVRPGFHFELDEFDVKLFGRHSKTDKTELRFESCEVLAPDQWKSEDTFRQGTMIAEMKKWKAQANYHMKLPPLMLRAPMMPPPPPMPRPEDTVNDQPNILVSVLKYGGSFYLGAKDIHSINTGIAYTEEIPTLETVVKVQVPSKMLIRNGKIYRFDKQDRVCVYNIKSKRHVFFRLSKKGMPKYFKPSYLISGKGKSEFFLTSKGSKYLYRAKLLNGKIFVDTKEATLVLPGVLMWQCEFQGKQWLLIKTTTQKAESEYILANFCPIMRDLDNTYQLGKLNVKVAELLSANEVGPAHDEQLLRIGDDVKAINPLWLKKNLEDFD